MSSLLVEVLLGIYLGLLTGIVPALVAGGLGFLFKYITGVTLPGLAVVALAVAIAGVSGGLLGLIDPTIAQSPRLLIALVLVMMVSLYSHAIGDRMGAELPRRFSLRELGKRTLASDVIVTVGGFGRVTLRPEGDIHNIDGFPPLSPDIRAELSSSEWEFPADLPLEELERRLETRLTRQYDFAEVDANIDERARVRLAAAPPLGSLSRRVPDGFRAVSIPGLVPTGVARGDRVRLVLPDRTIEATVVSAKSDPDAAPVLTDGGEETVPEAPMAPQTAGGEGRVTVLVSRDDARAILAIDRARILVLPRGHGLEYEAIRLLREAGNRFEKLTIGTVEGEGHLASLVDGAAVRVLAAYTRETGAMPGRQWRLDPGPKTTISAGDQLLVVGSTAEITAFRGRIT